MTDPRQQRLDEKTITPGIVPDVHEAMPLAPVDTAPTPYVREPLFSKKVLAGWALGTLMVWFAITVVVPEIVRSVKAEVRTRMAEPETNTPGEKVIETPAGRITIRRDAAGTIVVERSAPGGGQATPIVTVTTPQAAPAPPAPVAPPPVVPPPSPTN